MSNVLGGSYRPAIYGGTFHAHTTNQATRATGFERLMQAVSPNAFYNSDDRPDPPKCHENTRVAVINKIIEWATGRIDQDAFMLWLYGPAGAGKTAIARKVAEIFAEQGLLLASFLFFRSDSKRNTMTPLVANIAYRVTCVIPGTRAPINDAIEADPLILSYPFEVQITKLFFEPLRLLVDQGHFLHTPFPQLILIDGLDECLDQYAQTNLIQHLSSSVARYQLPLKFLIASRPESHIKSAIGLASQRSTISHLELTDDFAPDEDIRRFLTDKFQDIKMCHNLRSQIPPSWPSQQQIETLVRKASGQFIYAALAMRFINSACDSPKRQLDIVLELRPPINHNLPFAELDALYAHILSCAKNVDLVLRILSVNNVFLAISHRRVQISTIESVLGLEEGDVRIYLSPLTSLLEVWDSFPVGSYISFHHSSFMDFRHAQERSKNYYVDDWTGHTVIAQWVLQAFTRNIPNAPPSLRKADSRVLWDIHFTKLLRHSLWTPELERALENFSLGAFLDYVKRSQPFAGNVGYRDKIAPEFFNHLEANKKSDLHRTHATRYLEYAMLTINSHPPSAEKFYLLITVWVVLQKSDWWWPRDHYSLDDFERLCVTLFGFNSTDINWDRMNYRLMCYPHHISTTPSILAPICGHTAETKTLILEPILSHHLARVAISCIQYLSHGRMNTHDHLLAWAMKSKQSPWLWRQWMRVTSRRRHEPNVMLGRPYYPFPQSLRRSRQILYFEKIQTEGFRFYRMQRKFYLWTLNLLYLTLRKARKSDELTRALSKLFIPLSASLLFPRQIKRVRRAIDAYLDKFGTSSTKPL